MIKLLNVKNWVIALIKNKFIAVKHESTYSSVLCS